jgi:hypothetical protein
MNATVAEQERAKTESGRYRTGLLKSAETGYSQPDAVLAATDVLVLFRITPREGTEPEAGAAVAGEPVTATWTVVWTDRLAACERDRAQAYRVDAAPGSPSQSFADIIYARVRFESGSIANLTATMIATHRPSGSQSVSSASCAVERISAAASPQIQDGSRSPLETLQSDQGGARLIFAGGSREFAQQRICNRAGVAPVTRHVRGESGQFAFGPRASFAEQAAPAGAAPDRAARGVFAAGVQRHLHCTPLEHPADPSRIAAKAFRACDAQGVGRGCDAGRAFTRSHQDSLSAGPAPLQRRRLISEESAAA